MTMLVAVFDTDEQARLTLGSLEEAEVAPDVLDADHDGSSMTSTTES
jgi:hypothetical protein